MAESPDGFPEKGRRDDRQPCRSFRIPWDSGERRVLDVPDVGESFGLALQEFTWPTRPAAIFGLHFLGLPRGVVFGPSMGPPNFFGHLFGDPLLPGGGGL
eukprot:8789869-Pyramimonas_sp.AAC.1